MRQHGTVPTQCSTELRAPEIGTKSACRCFMIRIARLLCAVFFAATISGCGGSGKKIVNRGPYKDPMTQLSRLDTSTFIEVTEVRAGPDGAVVFCSGVRGLNIVDARDPSAMKSRARLVSRHSSPSYPRCQHVAMAGDIVYMSSRGDEIQPTSFVSAFDTSGSEPVEVASLVSSGESFEGLAAAGNRLYIAMHESGVAVVENRGDALVEVGRLGGAGSAIVNAWSVAVRDSVVYLADGTGGLAAIDVSDPASPVEIGRVAIEGAAIHIELDPGRSLAYVAAGQGGVSIVDISDAAAPAVLAVADTPGTVLQVAASDSRIYVADWNDIRVFDVTDPAAPRLLATDRVDSASEFARVLGIAAAGTTVYVGEWTGLYSYRFHPERQAPDIWLGRRLIEFPRVAAGAVDAAVVIVRNEGTKPLVIDQLKVTGGPFSVAESPPITIAPGGADVLEVVYRPDGDVFREGTLELRSDDPDEGITRLDLAGNRPGAGVGDVAPEVVVNLLDGGQWRLSEQRGRVVVLAYFATF